MVTSSVNWKLRDCSRQGPPTHLFTFGSTPLVPIVGDWDGDGVETAGYVKGGDFTLSNSLDGTGTLGHFTFGDPRGFPVAGDWDGNGEGRGGGLPQRPWQVPLTPTDGQPGHRHLHLRLRRLAGDRPLAGDWDGNGIDGIGYYMGNGAGTGTWNLRQTASGGTRRHRPVPLRADHPGYPVVGDWDTDGDVTVGTKSGLTWQLRNSNSAGPPDLTISLGSATPAQDLPMVWSAT